jgi:hypothetical protein
MIYTPLAECSRVDVCAVSAEFPPPQELFLRFTFPAFVLKRRHG